MNFRSPIKTVYGDLPSCGDIPKHFHSEKRPPDVSGPELQLKTDERRNRIQLNLIQ